jgi:hypothetical protein
LGNAEFLFERFFHFDKFGTYGREKIIAYRVSVRKPEGKRPLGRPRQRWECNLKTDIK